MMSLYPPTGGVVSASGGRVTVVARFARGGDPRLLGVRRPEHAHPKWQWDPMHVDVLSRDAAVVTATYRIPHLTPRGMPHVIAGALTAGLRAARRPVGRRAGAPLRRPRRDDGFVGGDGRDAGDGHAGRPASALSHDGRLAASATVGDITGVHCAASAGCFEREGTAAIGETLQPFADVGCHIAVQRDSHPLLFPPRGSAMIGVVALLGLTLALQSNAVAIPQGRDPTPRHTFAGPSASHRHRRRGDAGRGAP